MDYTMDIESITHCKKVLLSYDCLHHMASILQDPECWLCREQGSLCEPTLVEDVVDESGECVKCVLMRWELAERAEDAEKERAQRRWRDRKAKEMGVGYR
jgi:hypothetical protein